MKKNEIKEGSHYVAKVSGKLTTVRVDKIRVASSYGAAMTAVTVYDVTNLSTKRKTTFRSAQKFRSEARQTPKAPTWNPNGGDSRMDIPEPTTYGDRQDSLATKLRERKDTGVDKAPHLIVEARAGTGKTTTLVEGLRLVKGGSSKLTPSPQQAAVWEAMAQSKGRARTICFVAFNKSIATELQQRVQGCDAMTMHSMGFRAVTRKFGRVRVNSYRVQDIISELMERDIREIRKYKPDVLKATEKLVGLCKMNRGAIQSSILL